MNSWGMHQKVQLQFAEDVSTFAIDSCCRVYGYMCLQSQIIAGGP